MSIELHPVPCSPATAAATTSARENHLLAALLHEAPAEFARVSSALESCDLKAGHVLQNANDLMTEVHFPLSAMASCSTPLSDGEEVMTHFVGNEGVINADSALGSDCSFNKVVVERSGASLRMTAGAWRSAMAESAGLREQILRYPNRQSGLL